MSRLRIWSADLGLMEEDDAFTVRELLDAYARYGGDIEPRFQSGRPVKMETVVHPGATFKILPETGMKDCDGKMIWEDDVLYSSITGYLRVRWQESLATWDIISHDREIEAETEENPLNKTGIPIRAFISTFGQEVKRVGCYWDEETQKLYMKGREEIAEEGKETAEEPDGQEAEDTPETP